MSGPTRDTPTVHVVMVATLYRPASGPAAAAGMRAWGLATGLRKLGFGVTVITTAKRGAEPARDEGVEVITPYRPDLEPLARRLGFATEHNARAHRPGAEEPPIDRNSFHAFVSMFVPDRYASWIPAAAWATRRAGTPDSVVISTGPPSSRYAARAAHGRRPWIADINDLWALNPWSKRRPVRDRVDQIIEHATIGSADRFTTVNEPMAAELRNRYAIPVETVTSGYDPADFTGRARGAADGPTRILFAGTVYPTLDMEPVWTAIRGGKDEGWLTPATLRLTFVGPLSERMGNEARRLGLDDVVEAHTPLPRDALLDELVGADVLLLPLYERDPLALPMRFFEYVGSGRPILAVGPADRVAGRLIRQRGLGRVASNASEVRDALQLLAQDRGALGAGTLAAREAFTWQHSVERLAAVVLEAHAAAGSNHGP